MAELVFLKKQNLQSSLLLKKMFCLSQTSVRHIRSLMFYRWACSILRKCCISCKIIYLATHHPTPLGKGLGGLTGIMRPHTLRRTLCVFLALGFIWSLGFTYFILVNISTPHSSFNLRGSIANVLIATLILDELMSAKLKHWKRKIQ